MTRDELFALVMNELEQERIRAIGQYVKLKYGKYKGRIAIIDHVSLDFHWGDKLEFYYTTQIINKLDGSILNSDGESRTCRRENDFEWFGHIMDIDNGKNI